MSCLSYTLPSVLLQLLALSLTLIVLQPQLKFSQFSLSFLGLTHGFLALPRMHFYLFVWLKATRPSSLSLNVTMEKAIVVSQPG